MFESNKRLGTKRGRCKNCGKPFKEHYGYACTEKELEEFEEI